VAGFLSCWRLRRSDVFDTPGRRDRDNPRCGRFTLFAPAEQVAEAFAIPVPELFPRYNIAPSQPVAVVRADPGGRQLLMCKWGLVPSWSADGKGFINARAETAHDKPAFRNAFARRRCLIPANGWYEWKAEGSL
jgi:putative SOS response-associated peptidase YedK